MLAFFCVDIKLALHIADGKVWLDYRIAGPRRFEHARVCSGVVVVIYAVLWLEFAKVIRIQLAWVDVPDCVNIFRISRNPHLAFTEDCQPTSNLVIVARRKQMPSGRVEIRRGDSLAMFIRSDTSFLICGIII